MGWQRILIITICSVTLSSVTLLAQAENACQTHARIVSWEGALTWSASPDKAREGHWRAARREQTLCAGAVIRTGVQSRAIVALDNDTLVRLAPETVLILPDTAQPESMILKLQQGIGRFFSRVKHHFEVDAPFVNAAVSGTEFVVWADAQVNGVAVIEGSIQAHQPQHPGQAAVAVTGGNSLLAGERQGAIAAVSGYNDSAVDWSLYYPSIMTLKDILKATAVETDQQRLAEALWQVSVGQGDLAVTHLTNAPLSTMGAQSLALALRSVVSASRLQSQDALLLADQSIARDPQQLAGYLARAFAHQNLGQLDLALTDAEHAAALDPNHAGAVNRVTALLFFQGRLEDAQVASDQALIRFPDNAQTLAYAGLLALFARHPDQAETRFQQAYQIDPQEPIAPMGLGLVSLQRGQTEQARQHLDHALALDPNQSVLRSLLGQAFLAGKQDEKARTQWHLARELDPQDPSPTFYLGQLALLQNQPIQALELLTQAREQDPHRNVMRSDALIASDQAARSTALAQTYGVLGLTPQLRREGTQALREDPTLAQGHRLMADSWRGESRYQSAAASEQLQAQLWQPLSAVPLAPQLSETDLRIVEGAGPERGGLGEYHPLFIEEGMGGLVDAIVGPDNTVGNDAVLTALQGPVSVSLGQYRYRSDGFRDNADQDQQIINALAQWQIRPQTQIQMEYREFDWTYGDLGVLLGDEIPATTRYRRQVETLRLGGRTTFAPDQTLLFSAIRQTYDELQTDAPVPGVNTRATLAEIPESIELQHAGRWGQSQLISGAGFLHIDRTFEALTDVEVFPGLIVSDRLYQATQPTHTNFYSYVTHRPYAPLTLQLGLAWDELDTDLSEDLHQWSPKFGLIYSPTDTLDLRLAAFRSLRREMAAQQTLEPTNLAGFNQFFDDPNTADAHNLAIGIDHRPTSAWSWGAASHLRELDFTIVQDSTPSERFEQRQKTAEAYISHLLNPWASLNARVVWEQFTNDFAEQTVSEISEQTTRRFPLSANLFMGAWRLAFEVQYLHQKLNFSQLSLPSLTLEPQQTEQSAWVSNLGLQYALPQRLGQIAVGVDNLGDVERAFVRADGEFLQFYPARFTYARLQLVF